MRIRSGLAVLAVLALILVAVGCSPQQAAPPDTHVADEAAIRTADSTWSTIAEAKNVDGHVGYFVDDGVVLSPNEPIVEGKEAIHAEMSKMFALPGFSVKWQPGKVEAAGNLGYSRGTYELTVNDPKGNPSTEHGKYLTIWKKQADGSWKVAADMFSSDAPLVPPPSK